MQSDEIRSRIAKAIEVLEALMSDLRGPGGKAAPAPVASASDRTSFRTVVVGFWDPYEKDGKVSFKLRSRDGEDFWVNDEAIIKAVDPLLKFDHVQVVATAVRDAEGNPKKNKLGQGIFRVQQLTKVKPPTAGMKDGDPGSAFDAAHDDIPF